MLYLLKLLVLLYILLLIPYAWSDPYSEKSSAKLENYNNSYSANTKVGYAAADDIFPYGYQLAFRCKFIPIKINLSIINNKVRGEVINRYSEFNDYISDKECTTFHSGTFSGELDRSGKFKNVFIKHPTSSFNLHGFYRLDGSLEYPMLVFKHNHLFKYEKFSFKKIDNDLSQNRKKESIKSNEKLKNNRKRKTLKNDENSDDIRSLSKLYDLYKKGVISKKSFNKSKERLLKSKNIQELTTSDTEPPKIGISSVTIKDKQGVIEGVVQDNVEIAELKINNEEVLFYKEGNFYYTTFIPKGGKSVIIEATDTRGLSSKNTLFLARKNTAINKKIEFTALNPLKIKGKKNNNALALIIGINKYLRVPEAKYADKDATYFSDFANGILGVSEENILTLNNDKASETEIRIALKRWLLSYSTPKKSDIFIFYAGHGLASSDGKELYLLPYDGEPGLLEDTALHRSEIFKIIQNIEPKSVTIFLDTCYSGQTREKDMILADTRPITIVPVDSNVPENFTVFSASSGSQISGSLPEADHGLFSYFLMKGLEGDADTNADMIITTGELHTYVRSNVIRQAVRLGRDQTPQLQGDENRVLVEFN